MSVFGTIPAQTHGQLNVTATDWPFLQTWEFSNDSDVEIVFEKPGADEIVVLNFESGGTGLEDYAYIELDRSSGPAGADLHMTIYDAQLNHDPTQEDSVWFLTNGTYGVSYNASAAFSAYEASEFGDNGALKIDYDAASVGTAVIQSQDNADCSVDLAAAGEYDTSVLSGYHCFTETGSNTGIFTNGDDSDVATAKINTAALRGTTATIDYNDSAQSYLVTTSWGTIDMAGEEAGDEWNSGESITVTLVDEDRNLNTASDEDITVATSDNVPTISIGSPIGLADGFDGGNGTYVLDDVTGIATLNLERAAAATDRTNGAPWTFDLGGSGHDNVDINNMNSSVVQRYVTYDLSDICVADTVQFNSVTGLATKATISYGTEDLGNDEEDLICTVTSTSTTDRTITIDFIAFGPEDNHGIYRVEVEETDDNTGIFEGSVEFIMLNQNTIDSDQSGTLDTISDGITMLLSYDYTGTDAPRIKYNDTDGDGVYTGIADQVDAPTHSGTVTFDQESYKVADTVTITVNDQDLNTDSELIDVYITQTDDRVGDGDAAQNHVLDVYFGDYEYNDDCETALVGSGLYDTGFQLVETGIMTGVFTGTFQIPSDVCTSTTASASSTGLDMFVNYWDFRDAGGNEIETGSAATVAANSGSVSLDRTVYPVHTIIQLVNSAIMLIQQSDGVTSQSQ